MSYRENRWNRNEIVIDDIFAYNVELNSMEENEDLEPTIVEKCRHRNDGQNGKTQSTLN